MTTVLQIIPSLGAGGAEQACVDIAAGLVAAGHRALVVSSGGPRVAEVERAGGEHIMHPVASKNPATMLANAFWLAKLIRERKIEVIHARSRAPAWSAYWASQMTGCAFVTTFHAAYKFSNPAKQLYNSVMAKGNRVIAISQFIAKHIGANYRIGSDKIRTIPRGVDLDKFAPEKIFEERRARLRQVWGVNDQQKIILMPARLSPIKGHRVLIEAMALLPALDAVAVIIGDDQGRVDYRRELERMIAMRGLERRVRLASHCADMPAAYSLATVAVAPSLVAEGFGRMAAEAAAMGIPAIASDIGGFIEIIRADETGWLVPADHVRDLVAALTKALALDPATRAAMAQKAVQEAHAHYDKRKMVADTLSVYDELRRA